MLASICLLLLWFSFDLAFYTFILRSYLSVVSFQLKFAGQQISNCGGMLTSYFIRIRNELIILCGNALAIFRTLRNFELLKNRCATAKFRSQSPSRDRIRSKLKSSTSTRDVVTSRFQIKLCKIYCVR